MPAPLSKYTFGLPAPLPGMVSARPTESPPSRPRWRTWRPVPRLDHGGQARRGRDSGACGETRGERRHKAAALTAPRRCWPPAGPDRAARNGRGKLSGSRRVWVGKWLMGRERETFAGTRRTTIISWPRVLRLVQRSMARLRRYSKPSPVCLRERHLTCQGAPDSLPVRVCLSPLPCSQRRPRRAIFRHTIVLTIGGELP